MRKRSKYRPKGVIANPVQYVISGLKPPDKGVTLRVVTDMHIAYENFRTGKATQRDWDALADVVNHTLVLAKQFGVGTEYYPLAKHCRETMIAIGERYKAGKGFGLTGPQLSALQELLELHEEQIKVVDADTMAKAVSRALELRRTGVRYSPKGPNHGNPPNDANEQGDPPLV